MAEDVFKLPLTGVEVPKPKAWDLIAAFVVALGLAGAGANLTMALRQAPGESIGGGLTAAVVGFQLAVCVGSLLILGKTAKLGTLWGNLAAVAGILVGMSGVLLAAALWSAA